MPCHLLVRNWAYEIRAKFHFDRPLITDVRIHEWNTAYLSYEWRDLGWVEAAKGSLIAGWRCKRYGRNLAFFRTDNIFWFDLWVSDAGRIGWELGLLSIRFRFWPYRRNIVLKKIEKKRLSVWSWCISNAMKCKRKCWNSGKNLHIFLQFFGKYKLD